MNGTQYSEAKQGGLAQGLGIHNPGSEGRPLEGNDF